MSSKLSISDVAGLISGKSGLTKKECEAIVKEVFQLASETVSSGESLTIKGLGTFKLVWVEPRGSVDINTGASITIPGHYKLAYVPEAALRNAVNEPFAYFATEVLPPKSETEIEKSKRKDINENIIPEPEGTTSEEEQNEMQSEPEGGETAVQEETGKNVSVPAEQQKDDDGEAVMTAAEDLSVQSDESTVSETCETEQIDMAVSEICETVRQPVSEEAATISAPSEERAADTVQDKADIEKEYRRRTRNGYIAGFATAVLLFLIIGGGAYYFYSNSKNFDITLSVFKFPFAAENKEEPNKPDTAVVEKEAGVPIPETASESDVAADTETVVETIEPGKFLTTIALKHYGNKIFWVYIYRENEDKIWNPRYLPKGFKVVVPPRSKYGIDSEDEVSIRRAQDLEKQILYEIE